jgi:uncharacterized protein
MKKYLISLLLFLCAAKNYGQDITGIWNGVLSVEGQQLTLKFNIVKTETGYTATMDSPDQGAKGIKINTTTYENGLLTLKVDAAKIEYTATLNKENIFEGTFKQGGLSVPLNLSRSIVEKQKLKRPQEPIAPFDYYTEEVTFNNVKENITLAGTLTLPTKEGKFPVVVLVSGSGPQNRNEELLGHKPFLLIADYFAKNGIGVLRYDDRGVGKSTGKFSTATSFNFANDADAAVQYLKTRQEVKSIGIAGHSEGGIIAPIVAAQNNAVNFIILLAGTGVRGDKLLLEQNYLIAKVSGASDDELKKAKALNAKIYNCVLNSKTVELAKSNLTTLLTNEINLNSPKNLPNGVTEADVIKSQVDDVTSAWGINLLKYDPAVNLKKVKCPVLALNGDKDLQVPSTQNLPAIKKALTSNGNKNVTTKEFKNLNHLFQETTTGNPNEYGTLEQTMSPIVLETMVQWIIGLKK